MDKNGQLINLINSLIKSFNDYDNNLKNRFKADSIILSLEENADKNLNKLINLSYRRYKDVKYGIKLDNILNRQKTKYEQLNKEIQNDKLYSSNIIDLEKAKLFKSAVTIKNKEIYNIRENLISNLRSNKDNLKNRIVKKQSQNNKITSKKKTPKLKIKIENNNTSSQSSLRNSLKFLSNKYIRSRKGTIKNNNKYDAHKFLDNLVKEDYKTFFSTIDSYHTFLGKLKNISNEKYDGKGIKISKDNFEPIQTNLSPNCLNFLTYRENNSQLKAQNKIKKDLEFDIKKIQSIKTTYDKKNKLKNKLIPYNMNENIQSETLDNIHNKNRSLSLNIIKNFNNNNMDNYNNSFDKNNNLSYKKNKINKTIIDKKNYNYRNTANIVLNETKNGLLNSQNFINKRKIFNNYFNKCFQNSNNKQKQNISNKKKNINELKNEYIKRNSIKVKNEIFEYNQKKKFDIKKDFQDIYEQKKLEWKEEEKQNKLKKLKEEQELKDINDFLLYSDRKHK